MSSNPYAPPKALFDGKANRRNLSILVIGNIIAVPATLLYMAEIAYCIYVKDYNSLLGLASLLPAYLAMHLYLWAKPLFGKALWIIYWAALLIWMLIEFISIPSDNHQLFRLWVIGMIINTPVHISLLLYVFTRRAFSVR